MPYTRAQLIAAVKKDHPEFANIDDNTLFRAIATDHPDLALGAAEYQNTQLPGHAPDDRSAGQVALDQTGSVLKGAAGIVTGIPGMVSNLAHAGYEHATGQDDKVAQRAIDIGKGLYDQVTAPVKPIMQTVAPGTFGEATPEAWQHGAEAAGANAAQLIAAKVGPKVIDAADAATQPEALMTKAAAARAAVNNMREASIPSSRAGAAMTAIKTVARPAVNGLADLAERAAKYRAGPPEAVGAVPTIDPIESVQQNAQPQAPPQQAPAPDPAQPQYSDAAKEMVRRASGDEVPHPRLPDPGFKQGDVPEFKPGTSRVFEVDQSGTPNPVQNGPSPLDGREPYVRGSVTREPVTELPGPDGQPQYPQTIAPDVPAQRTFGNGTPVEHPVTEPPPGEEPTFGENVFHEPPMTEPGVEDMSQAVPASQPPLQQEAAAPPVGQAEPPMQYPIQQVDPAVQTTIDALITRGKGAGAAQLATQNATHLLDLMPELRGIPDGAKFDSMLYNKFQAVGHDLAAKMDSIPGEKSVSTAEAKAALTDIADKAHASYLNSEGNAIKKLADMMDESGSTQWKDIVNIKRSLDGKLDISSGPGREAYQVFKQLTEKVDPSLSKLNKDWYTLKTSTELADMDPGGKMQDGSPRMGGGTRPKAEARARVDAAKTAVKSKADAAKAAAKGEAETAKAGGKAKAAEKSTADKAKAQAEKDAKIKAAMETRDRLNAEKAAKKAADDKAKANQKLKDQKLKRSEKLATPTKGMGTFRSGAL